MAAMIAIAGASVTSAVRSSVVTGVFESSLWLATFIVVGVALACFLIYSIHARIEELHLQSRLQIEYFPARDQDEGDAAGVRLYRAARKLVGRAKEDGSSEILAVNWFADMFAESASGDVEKARVDYHKCIESKLGKVDYHRIVQYRSLDDTALAPRIASSYSRHFREVMKVRDGSSNRRVRLDRVDPRYPTAFLIIENKGSDAYLLWQLNEHFSAAGAQCFRPRGVLVISDPEQQLIQHFKIGLTTSQIVTD